MADKFLVEVTLLEYAELVYRQGQALDERLAERERDFALMEETYFGTDKEEVIFVEEVITLDDSGKFIFSFF